MHEKHKGHDAMHAEMIFILIITLIVAQVVLVEWKKRHFRSYQVIKNSVVEKYELTTCNIFLDGVLSRNVGDSFRTFIEESMVEIHLHMATLFLHHWTCSKESYAKASRGNHSTVKAEILLFFCSFKVFLLLQASIQMVLLHLQS